MIFNQKNKKRLMLSGTTMVLFVFVIFTVKTFLIPASVNPEKIKIYTADIGPVALSVPATGVVNPENEVLLLSPASSIISKIHVAPGSRVRKGDVIMSLDTRSIVQEIEKLKDQLGIMENDLQKNQLNSRSTRVDLDYNADVKKLRIKSLETEITDQEQLLKVGGISPALFEQTKQELVLAEKDLKMTQEKNSIRLKQLETEETGLLLQIDVREKELESKMELLGLLNIKAPSNGIILDISGNTGEKVDKDKLLVKMSDLSTYKIKSSVDNRFLENLKIGGTVYAIIDDARLKGKIGNISPVINNKKINFDVFLDYSKYDKLIPNLEVNLMIVTCEKDSVLRISNGAAFNRNRQQHIYVVKNNKAVRTRITTGLIGTDYIEIESGLKPGDRVITSDFPSLRRRREIDFQNF